LTAVAFLGWKIAGLPFAPFDIFDWIVRLLPGALVTAAIETTVALSRAFGVTNISAAAKTGDQVLAVAGLLGAGMVSGAVLFAVLSASGEPALMFGAILGAMLGGLALIAERQLQRLPPGSLLSGVWVFATFVAWGIAFGWAHERSRSAAAEDSRGRRQFLRTLAASSVLASSGATLVGLLATRWQTTSLARRWSDDHRLPNADADVRPVAGTRAEFTPLENFYRIDTDTRAPSIDASRWRLNIGGLVEQRAALTFDELRAMPSIDAFATLCCISNPAGGDLISTTRWTGVSLQGLLPRMKLLRSATHLKLTSADGFFETVALDAIGADERLMLAYAWDGVPLPIEHGYPLRLYVPDVYGMKQPKWVVGVDAISQWEPGYWVSRGWSRDGRVSTASAIDVVNISRDRSTIEAGGFAFAGARRVSKVEIRVGDGEWNEAQIRRPLSDLAWVIWRAVVPAGPGTIVLSVRAFDASSAPQSAPFHSRRITV
jgi:DMSO/TMAO reductase YedYZ molybdopterin-dependent catalytic subunit